MQQTSPQTPQTPPPAPPKMPAKANVPPPAPEKSADKAVARPADPPPPNPYVERLAEAELMLLHASRGGAELEAGSIAGIVEAKHALENDTWSAPTEVAFWAAYNHLAQTIRPLSLDSLKALYNGQENDTNSRFRRHIWYYQLGSIVFLLLMLVFQAYWVMGSMLMDDIKGFNEKVAELTETRRNLQELLPEDKRANNLELNRVDLELDNYFNRRQASFDILDGWKPSNLVPREILFEDDWGSTTAQATTEIEMRFTLQIIQLYILPLFYGLLGAFAYVLRNLSNDFMNAGRMGDAKVNYRLRLQLGALAGLAIGWFISPSLSQGALSPLALAFLAGYSVEVLFAGMDKMIAHFASTGEQPRRFSPDRAEG